MRQKEKAMERKLKSLRSKLPVVADKGNERLALLRDAISRQLIVKLDPSEIVTDSNIRKSLDEESEEFNQLVQSIKKYGFTQNIVVELIEESDGFKLVCVAGHRRLRALEKSGLKEKVPAIVKEFKRAGASTAVALSENVNRKDLHFLDVAEAYKDLIDSNEMTRDDICIYFDRNSKTIGRYLKMARWPEEVKSLVRKHPNIFNARTALLEFAARSFESDDALLKSVQEKISGKPAKKASKKEMTRKSLETYFSKSEIDEPVKDEILKALKYLKLI